MSSKSGLRKWHPLKLNYSTRALDDLRKISKIYLEKQAMQITEAFSRFAETGMADVRPFRRLDKGLELRVGRFRAILQIEDGIVSMVVVGMKKSQKI
ncbi:MAG: hypothetical protein AB1476_04870 [Candidatus Hadarchaeota archaeon]